jgi:hypothetical protein
MKGNWLSLIFSVVVHPTTKLIYFDVERLVMYVLAFCALVIWDTIIHKYALIVPYVSITWPEDGEE